MNYQKFLQWTRRTVVASVTGFCIASIATHFLITKGQGPFGVYEMWGRGAIAGIIFAIIPALIALWFLLLHMIGQLRDAIKGK